MPTHGGATALSGQSSKPKKPKSREVSSRFLSTSSTEHQSPSSILSPLNQKPRPSTDSRKHKSLDSGFLRGLWPSSSVLSPSSNFKPDTLADCIGNDRIKELEEQKRNEKPDRNTLLLNRQRSCSEFSRFEKEKKTSVSAKENHNPIFGGSMRYTGKFKFPRKSSKYLNSSDENEIIPGRFSVDEDSLRKKSLTRGLSDSDECSDVYSDDTSFDTPVAGKGFPASYMAPTLSSRKHGIEIPSKFMNDLSSRSRRWSADSKPVSSNSNENSTKMKSWPFSVGRSGSMKASMSDKKGKMIGLTGLKPPTSPSRGKGVGNILSLGIELLKGKRSSSSSSSPLGPGPVENFHQLRLLHNRLMQWRYSVARVESVNGNIITQVEGNFVQVWNGLIKLHRSVVQKKLQLQKENLDMKLNCILHSQIKTLETWGNMEGQHLLAVTNTTDYLHYVICRIPLVDGAKVEPLSASIALRHASDLATSMKLMLSSFSSSIEETEGVFAELARVVIQEKQLLEECMELFRYISKLEIQERSLEIMQLRFLQQQKLP
ncbi:hypothetical protein ACS0TY_017525 [Phlomoides rotata]